MWRLSSWTISRGVMDMVRYSGTTGD